MKNLHTSIRKRRIEYGYSTTQMAELLNMSQSAYSKLERGESRMDVERLFEISEVLKTPVNEFFLPVNSNQIRNCKDCSCADLIKEVKQLIVILKKQ